MSMKTYVFMVQIHSKIRYGYLMDAIKEKLVTDPESQKIPRTIWVLGVVSFFMNSASVVITSLTPFFITQVLGASEAAVGHIRGVTEALSYLVKLCSGVISDYIGKRKALILFGYGCAAITKPIFGFANTIFQYTVAQIIERVANGMRDTPRDALIADCVPKKLKGTSYGIRQSFATAGSMFGSLGCFFLLAYLSSRGNSIDNARIAYFIATIPSLIAVVLLFWGISDSNNVERLKNRKGFPIKKNDLKQLGGRFCFFMFVLLVFMMARFSEAFLVLRAQELGWDLCHVSLVLTILYLFNSITSKIAGTLSDRIDRRLFLGIGFLFMIVSCFLVANSSSMHMLICGVIAYGIHYGSTQGTFFALVADYSPPQIKGTSFGIFNLVCALGMFVSNSLTGVLWKNYGAHTAMMVEACIASVAFLLFLFLKRPVEK